MRSLGGARFCERGQIAAFVVAILVVLFGFLALTTDVGLWFRDRRVAQNEADAAVLAAVQDLPATEDDLGDVATVALDYLEANGGEPQSSCSSDNSSDASLPPYDRFPQGVAFADADGDGLYDTVRVCVAHPSKVFLTSVFGLAEITIHRVAAAQAPSIHDGDPWSSLSDPCTGNGAGLCSSDDCQDFDPDNPEPGTYCATTFTDTLYMPHDVNGLYVFTGDVTIDADVYLAPHSDYVFMGNVTILHGQLFGDDVFLYLTCNPTPCQNQTAGRLSIGDHAELRLGGDEIVIWVDRQSRNSGSCNSPAGANIVVGDDAYFTVNGGIYDPTGTVYFDSNGTTTIRAQNYPPPEEAWSIVAGRVCNVAGGDVFSYGDIYLGGTGSAGLDEISGDRHIISGGGSGLIE